MSDIFETTPEQFAAFKDECEYWIDRMGLKSWWVDIEHVDLEDESVTARCLWKSQARRASLRLNTKSNENASESAIRRAAFHEVCELMLSPISDGLYEAWGDRRVDTETHIIIHMLENTLWAQGRPS